MAWFRRRRRGYLSCDYFSVTPFLNWEYAAAYIHIHYLEGTFKKAVFFYFHLTRARYEWHPDAIMPMQCTIYGAITWHHFGFAKCSRCWDILEKHTYIHTYKQTNMTWTRFQSLVGLRLRAFGAQPPSEQLVTHWKVIGGLYTLLLRTFDCIEIETWGRCQNVFPVDIHQIISNMIYFGHFMMLIFF